MLLCIFRSAFVLFNPITSVFEWKIHSLDADLLINFLSFRYTLWKCKWFKRFWIKFVRTVAAGHIKIVDFYPSDLSFWASEFPSLYFINEIKIKYLNLLCAIPAQQAVAWWPIFLTINHLWITGLYLSLKINL